MLVFYVKYLCSCRSTQALDEKTHFYVHYFNIPDASYLYILTKKCKIFYQFYI